MKPKAAKEAACLVKRATKKTKQAARRLSKRKFISSSDSSSTNVFSESLDTETIHGGENSDSNDELSHRKSVLFENFRAATSVDKSGQEECKDNANETELSATDPN